MKHIKWIVLVMFTAIMLLTGVVTEADSSLTILVYMCGSDLESKNGSASKDLNEMASAMDSDQINLLVMAGGSASWNEWRSDIEADKVCITQIASEGRSRVVDHLDSMNMGASDTLSYFFRFAMTFAPAREYALIIWNHGAGPLEGVCMDEFYTPDTLSIQEIGQAIDAAQLPGKLKWIGFDACLMSTVEVANAVAPYADYMIASEESEPPEGWNYAFLNGLQGDEHVADMAKQIIDLYLETPHDEGVELTLACIDLSQIDDVIHEMDAFFSPISRNITEQNFVELAGLRVSSTGFGRAVKGIGAGGYDLVDLADLVQRFGEGYNPVKLLNAISNVVVYSGSVETGASGLSVYHPYFNRTMFKDEWKSKYNSLSFCKGYAEYVDNFGSLLLSGAMAEWKGLVTTDEGLGTDTYNWFSLQLTPEQQASFLSAQLIALYPQTDTDVNRFTEISENDEFVYSYSPVYISNASMDEDGLLTAYYAGRALYATDAEGNAILGPLSYRLSDDGETYYICAQYRDTSGQETYVPWANVMFSCKEAEDGRLSIVRTQVYDTLSATYSNRLALIPERYNRLAFDSLAAESPYRNDVIPGFDEWTTVASKESIYYSGYTEEIDSNAGWQFRFFDYQLSGLQTYVAFQVTDMQQNTFMSELLPVRNPNLKNIIVKPGKISKFDYDVNCHVVRDVSPLNPSLSVCLELTSRSDNKVSVSLDQVILNGERSAGYITDQKQVSLGNKGASGNLYFHINISSLTNLDEIQYIEILLKNESQPLLFMLSQCDISDIAPQYGQPLAKATDQYGVTMQLMALERNSTDTIFGTLHIINDSHMKYNCREEIALNDLSLESECEYCSILPGTDGYVAFKAYDSAFLSGSLEINRTKRSRLLNLEGILSRYSSEMIDRIHVLHTDGYNIQNSWQFNLSEPLFLGNTTELDDTDYTEPLPLLDGDISAWVERVMVADHGVGLRLILRNDSETDTCIFIANSMLNGISVDDKSKRHFFLSAHSTRVTCISIDATYYHLDPGTEITDFGFTFGYDNYGSTMASITLKKPMMMGMLNGAYLSVKDIETHPVKWNGNHAIHLTGTDYETDLFQVKVLSIKCENDLFSLNSTTQDIAMQGLRIGVAVEVNNRSDLRVDAVSSELVLNGGFKTVVHWAESDIAPHSERIYTCYIESEVLMQVDRLERLQCTLDLFSGESEKSDMIESINLDVLIDGIDSNIFHEKTTPLCETKKDGVNWQLISLEADEDGRLRGWLNIINNTDEPKEFLANTVLVEGIHGDSYLPEIKVEAGYHSMVPFTFENNVRIHEQVLTIPGTNGYAYIQSDHLLQRRGIYEISQLTFVMKSAYAYDTGKGMSDEQFTMKIPSPIDISYTDYPEKAKVLLTRMRDVSIWLESVLIGDHGISFVIECQNESNSFCKVDIKNSYIDHIPRSFNHFYTALIPHATYVSCVVVNAMPPGEYIQNIYIPFFLDNDECIVNIHLNEAVQLQDAGEYLLYTGSDYTVNVTELDSSFAENVRPYLPVAVNVHPKKLIAPLDEEKQALFLQGQVSIVVEQFQRWYEEYTCAEEYVIMDLHPDESGQISAQYSGLTLLWTGDISAVYEETVGNITELTATIFEFKDVYMDYQPGSEGDLADPPEPVPSGEPAYYEEDSKLDPGIKVRCWYRIQNTDLEMKLLDYDVERSRLETGEELDDSTKYEPVIGLHFSRSYYNGNYQDAVSHYQMFDDDCKYIPSLLPVDLFDRDKIKVRYHIYYTDGSDEVIVTDYPG